MDKNSINTSNNQFSLFTCNFHSKPPPRHDNGNVCLDLSF